MDSNKWISKKIVIVGSHAVGKTSLISRFVYQKFPENYLTTIGLKVDKKSVELENATVDLIIWDIAGHDNITRIPQYYLNGCSGLIFVFDLTRPITFQNIEQQIKLLRGIVGEEAILILAGNKTDLFTDEELAGLMTKLPVKPHFTTSAKSGTNVEALFKELATQMIARHPES